MLGIVLRILEGTYSFPAGYNASMKEQADASMPSTLMSKNRDDWISETGFCRVYVRPGCKE